MVPSTHYAFYPLCRSFRSANKTDHPKQMNWLSI